MKFILFCQVDIQESSREDNTFKIQLSRDNLGERKVLESAFSGFQQA